MTQSPSTDLAAVSVAAAMMRELAGEHPGWFALYDDSDPDSCSREDLDELMATAPNHFAFGVCYGKFTMRLEIEGMTGRPFE